MKFVAVGAFLAGGLLAVLLVAHFGASAVLHALQSLGWRGFAIIVAYHLCLFVPMGFAWWALGNDRPEGKLIRFVWGRLVRDSASEVLPFSQMGGFVIGARAATMLGVPGVFAAASTVVDLTMELVAQLVYTALGLALLVSLVPDNGIAVPVLIAISGMTFLAIVFFFVQARGAGLIEGLAMRLAAQWLSGAFAGNTTTVRDEIHSIHARRLSLAIGSFTHLVCWVLSGAEAWLTLRFMGLDIDLSDAIVIDSLLYGIRSFAFMVPNALGVQEGAYVLLGSIFGIPAETALALSFVKRGRDIVLGVPALLVWQALEGRRVLVKSAAGD